MKRVLSFVLPAVVSVALLVLSFTINQWYLLPYLVIGILFTRVYLELRLDPFGTVWFSALWVLLALGMLVLCWAPPFITRTPSKMFQPAH